jgi:hypothetical protein
MQKKHLRAAQQELFRRPPDECFASLAALAERCRGDRDRAQHRWQLPVDVTTLADDSGRLKLEVGRVGALDMNDWSFSQLCKFAGVSKETVNRLSAETACAVFRETLPISGTKPWQLFTDGAELIRSIHGAAYTRLLDAEVIELVEEFADGFQPPQRGVNQATGLYRGEQDMFVFLIDPTGWIEIEGEAFAPGLFLWNSEVGRRSLGIQTFWFQSVCQNHLVWDAVEVTGFQRKHTANVRDSLADMRDIIAALVHRRDARRDSFARVIARAMQTRLGDDADEVLKVLVREGIPRGAATTALEIAARQGRFTIFSVVDALTRLAGQLSYAGDRSEADLRASRLLALAA